MDKLIDFFTILAWFAGIVSFIFFWTCLYLTFRYPGSIDELEDRYNGVKRTYPVYPWLITAIVSFAFLISF